MNPSTDLVKSDIQHF